MINLQLTASYFRHQLTAKTRHGIHSPFVYRLADEIIYNDKPNANYKKIENLRNQLLTDDRIITVTDLGAGSQVNNNTQKTVKQIAKNALKPSRIAQLISRIGSDVSPKIIIELGTCFGLTTAYFATESPEAKVITIEGCDEIAAVANENFTKLNVNNVDLRTGNFDDVLPQVLSEVESADVVFIDGNHRKEATLNYFNRCLPKLNETSVMIFDDIYWSAGMKEAWNEIKNHPQVSVSIDLFWIGLVFFKKGQVKENFRIRI